MKAGTSQIARSVLHGQGLYATHDSGAERNVMKNATRIRREKDKDKELWAQKVLLVACCVLREAIVCSEVAFVSFMELVLRLDAVDDALGCGCLL